MKNRAFVKYKKTGEIVPGSLLITQGGYPKGGPYKEITMDLCCDTSPCAPQDFGAWKVVTGGTAGDGVVLNDDNGDPNLFTIVGPDDSEFNGWVYMKRFFPLGAELSINYQWTSFDEGTGVDRPVYWWSTTEPTGIPDDLGPKVGMTPETSNWVETIPPGNWFAVGIYSTDSCCGRGFLKVDFNL